MENQKISSISISGEIILNLHSLNNEGGEGNQIMTRQLTIINKEGKEYTVNGISGDMFKHIHTAHLINYAKVNNLNLCSNCKIGNPNRLSGGVDLSNIFSDKEIIDKDVIDAVIKTCTIDDCHGVLITSIGTNKKNIARKSIIEFGWTIGIPDKNNTETFLHTKLVSDAAGKRGESSNEGQNIFHRPANHGIYAFVCNIDVYRIGLNDITREYAIDENERINRFKGIIQSLINSFLDPKGAMTSTQKPHITDFRGVVTTSKKLIPAPTISAINPDYIDEIIKITENLNKIENDSINLSEFNGLADLSKILADLINCEPYSIPKIS